MRLAKPLKLSEKRKRLRIHMSKSEKGGWLTSLPLILIILVMFAYPSVNAIRLSLTSAAGEWIGFSRFVSVLKDPQVAQSLRFSVVFTVSSVILHFVIGLFLALMLTNRYRNPAVLNVFRGLLILPWVISMTVAAPMIKLLFHQLGVFNYFFVEVLHITSQPIAWMGDPVITPIFIIIISGWQGFPLFMILFIGSIQAIPNERFEAARIDGANSRQVFRHITLPGITGTALRLIVLDSIWLWRAFEIVYLITSGGPMDKTSLLSYLVYTTAFKSAKLNYAAATAVLMAVVSIIVTAILLKVPEPEVAD